MLNRNEFKNYQHKISVYFKEVYAIDMPDLSDFDVNYFKLHRFENKKGITLRDLETRSKIFS